MATSNAPVARRQDNGNVLQLTKVIEELDKRSSQFLSLLDTPEAVERFRTVSIHAISSKPDLMRCDLLSIIEAVREAASLNLEPTGSLGEAWLIPYKGQAKLRIGWQGYLKLIRRSGLVRFVDCQVVYQNDTFEIELGTNSRIVHLPALTNRGSYRGAYAWAELLDGTRIIEWLPVEDAAAIRKIAAADSMMWRDFPGEAYRKSAIRRLQKRLPKSAHIEVALRVEAEAEDVEPVVQLPARAKALAALAERYPEQADPAQPAESAEQGGHPSTAELPDQDGGADASPSHPELDALWDEPERDSTDEETP